MVKKYRAISEEGLPLSKPLGLEKAKEQAKKISMSLSTKTFVRPSATFKYKKIGNQKLKLYNGKAVAVYKR